MSAVAEKFKHIVDLRICKCKLKYIERSKLAVFSKRLRILDLYNNNIETLPVDTFDDLTQLHELKILNNRIKHLPENLFRNLKNLKMFNADYNEIEELPKRFFDPTPQIVSIQMNNNELSRIYVNFCRLSDLNVIDFSQNACINQCLGHYCGKISVDEMQKEIDEKCSINDEESMQV
jgi:Leucine-rich repeat (LRR) protein